MGFINEPDISILIKKLAGIAQVILVLINEPKKPILMKKLAGEDVYIHIDSINEWSAFSAIVY